MSHIVCSLMKGQDDQEVIMMMSAYQQLSSTLWNATGAARRGAAVFAFGFFMATVGMLQGHAAQAPQAGPDVESGAPIRNMDALSVVLLRAKAAKDAQSSSTLGTERAGSGIVIDDSGLILTIGYLIVEAEGVEIVPADGKPIPATVVGYDNATGFGLVRATCRWRSNPSSSARPIRCRSVNRCSSRGSMA